MTKAEALALCAKGEGCLGQSADDEPVFLLCARDVLAAGAVYAWINAAELVGVPAQKKAAARHVLREMVEWQKTHAMKVPD